MLPLFKHQQDGVEFLKRGRGAALFFDMGLGKTRTILEHFASKTGYRLLIICPLSLIEAAWHEDVRKFTKHLSFHNLHKDFSFPDANIYAINYESFISKKKRQEIVKFLSTHKVICCVDESSRMKNHKSLTTKTLLSMRHLFAERIIMSGCPAPNSEIEFWGQMEFLKEGILHPSFFAFRNTFFHLQRGNQIMQGAIMTRERAREIFSKGWKYEISDMKRQQLMQRINPHALWRKKEDCLDLPPMIDEFRTISFKAEQRRIYNEMKRHLITEIGNKIIAIQVALAKLTKLRQISSGFAYDSEGKTHTIKENNPRVEELKAVIEESGGKQMIIWINFHEEVHMLEEELSKIGTLRTLYSGTKDKDESIRSFIDGTARFLIAHPRSAGHGLTFVNCDTQVFFSLDFSYECYVQAKARTHRAGQTKSCTYIHLIADNSIDENIYDVLKRKKTIEQSLMEITKCQKLN